MVQRDVEEAPDLAGVQVHGEDAVCPRGGEQVGHKFAADRLARPGLAVLPAAARVWDDCGDARRPGAARGPPPRRPPPPPAPPPSPPPPTSLGRITRAGTPTTTAPAGTSFVTTDPAPVVAPLPIRSGATSIVSLPMNASSSMIVGHFLPERSRRLQVIVPAPMFTRSPMVASPR